MTKKVEIFKGKTEKVVVEPWTSEKGGKKCRVSIGTFYLHKSGDYNPTGKSFALTPEEARETAAALIAVADLAEAENHKLEEELIAQGKA